MEEQAWGGSLWSNLEKFENKKIKHSDELQTTGQK